MKQFSLDIQADKEEPITYHFFGFPVNLNSHKAQLKGIHQTSVGSLEVGTSFVQEDVLSGIDAKVTFQISEYNPPKNITCRFSGRVGLSGEVGVVLVPVVGGTKVIEVMKVEGGDHKLIWLFLASIMKKQMNINMCQMKVELESLPESKI